VRKIIFKVPKTLLGIPKTLLKRTAKSLRPIKLKNRSTSDSRNFGIWVFVLELFFSLMA
jgi:hypothetical protein